MHRFHSQPHTGESDVDVALTFDPVITGDHGK